MNDITIYILEFLFASTLFFVVYLLIKEHATPQTKRVFLLCWLLSSSIFPLISIHGFQYSIPYFADSEQESIPGVYAVETPKEFQNSVPAPVTDHQQIDPVSTPALKKVSFRSVIPFLYFTIAGLLFVRFLFGLAQILRMKKKSVALTMNGKQVYQVNQPGFTGASFYRWIFVGTDVDRSDLDLIIEHEMTHSRLGHSIDVILGNLYQIIFWVFPMSWYLLNQIKINAELEADRVLSQQVSVKRYGELLLNLYQTKVSFVLNNFSAGHLKVRIKSMTKPNMKQKWMSVLPFLLFMISFLAVSCSDLLEHSASTNSDELLDQRLADVKTITTKFISHQNDTQQKTGKLVSRVTFHPDGTLHEFVNKTSYPYDHEYETKRTFWDTPLKRNLFHAMDGLHLGVAERNILYGNNWSTAYLKFLRDNRKSETYAQVWDEKITANREVEPSSITIRKKYIHGQLSYLNSPDVTEFFTYEGDKITETSYMQNYHLDAEDTLRQFIKENENRIEFFKKYLAYAKQNNGIVKEGIKYFYDGDLLTQINAKEKDGNEIIHKFYYENNLMTRHEYYKYGKLVSTRVHRYKNGLKDRSEIFNIYNEPEYTIIYEYEFW